MQSDRTDWHGRTVLSKPKSHTDWTISWIGAWLLLKLPKRGWSWTTRLDMRGRSGEIVLVQFSTGKGVICRVLGKRQWRDGKVSQTQWKQQKMKKETSSSYELSTRLYEYAFILGRCNSILDILPTLCPRLGAMQEVLLNTTATSWYHSSPSRDNLWLKLKKKKRNIMQIVVYSNHHPYSPFLHTIPLVIFRHPRGVASGSVFTGSLF